MNEIDNSAIQQGEKKWPNIYEYAEQLFGVKPSEESEQHQVEQGVTTNAEVGAVEQQVAGSNKDKDTATPTPAPITSNVETGIASSISSSGQQPTAEAHPKQQSVQIDAEDEELMKIHNSDIKDAIAYAEGLGKELEEAANGGKVTQEEYDKMKAHYEFVAGEVNARIDAHNKEADEFQKAEQERKRRELEAARKKKEADNRNKSANANFVSNWYQSHQPSAGQSDTMGVGEGFKQGAAATKGKSDAEIAADAKMYIEKNSGVLADSAIRDYVSGAIVGNNLRKEYGDKLNWNLEPIDSVVLNDGNISKDVKDEFIKIRKGAYKGKRGNTYQDLLYGAVDEFVKLFKRKYEKVQKVADDEINSNNFEDMSSFSNTERALLSAQKNVMRLTAVDLQQLVEEAIDKIPKARQEALVFALSKNFNYDLDKAAEVVSREFTNKCLSQVGMNFDSDTLTIIASGLMNSIIGGAVLAAGRIASGDKQYTMLDVGRQNIANKVAEWGKEGGWGYAKIAANAAAGFVVDIPMFSAIGKAAGALTKGFVQNVALRTMPEALRSAEVGEQVFRGLSMTRSGRAIIGTSNGMFTGMIYSPLSYTTGTFSSGGDWSLGDAVNSAVRGGVEFGGMGAIGSIMNYGADKILKGVSGTGKGATAVRLGTNILAKDILTPGANAAFTTALASFTGEIHESIGSYYAEKFGEFLGMHLVGKAQAGKQGLREYRVNTSLNESTFTKAEMQSLGYGKIKDLFGDLMYNGEKGGTVKFGKDGSVKIDGRVNAEKLKSILESKDIPWTAKAKVLTVLVGDGSAIATPTVTGVSIEQKTNKKGKEVQVVKTFGTNGELVSCSDEFTDATAAQNEANRLNDIAYKNSVSIAEGYKNAQWGDVAHKYALQQVTREFGDIEVFVGEVDGLVNRVIEKQAKGEQLSDTEKRVYDTYKKAYAQELLSPTADTSLNTKRAFNERMGVDVDDILKKKYYEWTETEKKIVDDYIDILLGKKEMPERKRSESGEGNPPEADVPKDNAPKEDGPSEPEPKIEGETPSADDENLGGEPPIDTNPPADGPKGEDAPKTKEDLLNEVDIEDLIKARDVDDEMAEDIRGEKEAYQDELDELKSEASDAIDYANGEDVKKPNSWQYWADKFGLNEPKPKEPKPKEDTPPPPGDDNPPLPPKDGPLPPKPERPTIPDTDPKDMTDEDISREIATLQEYQDKAPNDFGEDLAARKASLEEERANREKGDEPKYKKGDELVVEYDGHPVTIVVDDVSKTTGEITKSHVKGNKKRPYHSRGKVVYERTEEEKAADREKRLNELSSTEFSGDAESDDKTLNEVLAEVDKLAKEAKTDKEKRSAAEHKQKIVTNFVTASSGLGEDANSFISVHATGADMAEHVTAMKGLDGKKRNKVVAASLSDGEIHINAGSSALKTAGDVRDAVTHETTHVFNHGESGMATIKEIAESYTLDELFGFLTELAGKDVAKAYRDIFDGQDLPEGIKRQRLTDEISAFYAQGARGGKPKETSNKDLNNILKQHNDAYNIAIRDRKLYNGRHNGGGGGPNGGLPEGAPGGDGNGSVLGIGFGGGRGAGPRRGSERHLKAIAELDAANKGKSAAEVLDEFLARPALSKGDAELAKAYADAKIAEVTADKEMAEKHNAPSERLEEFDDIKDELEDKKRQLKEKADKDKSDRKKALDSIEEATDKELGAKNKSIVEGVAQATNSGVKLYDGGDEDGRVENGAILFNSNRLLSAPNFAVGAMVVSGMGKANARALFQILFGDKTPFDAGRLAEFVGNNATSKTSRAAMLAQIGAAADNRAMLAEFKNYMVKALSLASNKSGIGLYSDSAKVVSDTIDAVISEMPKVKETSKDTTEAYSDLFGESPKKRVSEAAAKVIAPLLERCLNIKHKFDEWKAQNEIKQRKRSSSADNKSLEQRHKERLENLETNKAKYEREVAILEKEIEQLQKGEQGGAATDENGVPNVDNTANKIKGKKSELTQKRNLLNKTIELIDDAPNWLEKQKRNEELRAAERAAQEAALEAMGEEAMADGVEMDFGALSGRDQQKALENKRKQEEVEKKLADIRAAIDRAIEGGEDANFLLSSASEVAANDAASSAMFLLAGDVGADKIEESTGDGSVRRLFEEADNLDDIGDAEQRKIGEAALNEKNLRKFMGTWVYEFADGDFAKSFKSFTRKVGGKKVGDKGNAPILPEVWKNDMLYKMYPALKEIRVEHESPMSNNEGQYDPEEKTLRVKLSRVIFINGKSKNIKLSELEVKRTIAHELQHAIQFEENWAIGGSDDGKEVREYARKRTQDVVDFAAGILQSKRFAEFYDRRKSAGQQVESGELNQFIYDIIKSNDIYEKYRGVIPEIRDAIITIIDKGSAKIGEDGLFHADKEELDLFGRDHNVSREGSRAGQNSPIFRDIVGEVLTNKDNPISEYWLFNNEAKSERTGFKTTFANAALHGYKALTGEVQSRMVEERVGWTPEQRKRYGLEDSVDKYTKDLWDIDDAGGDTREAEDYLRIVENNYIPEKERISVYPENEAKKKAEDAKELFGDNGTMFSIAGKDYDDTHDEVEKSLGAKMPEDATVEDIDAEIKHIKELRTEANKEYLSGQPHSDVAKEDASKLRQRLNELAAEKAKTQEREKKSELESKVVSLTTEYLDAKGRGDTDSAKAAAKKISAAKKDIEASSMRGKYKAKVAELKQKFENVGDLATNLAKYINGELQPILAKEMGKSEFTSLMNSVRDIAKAWNAKEGDAVDKHTLTNKLDEAVRKVDDTIVGIEIRGHIKEAAKLLDTKMAKTDGSGRKVGVKASNDVRVAIETMRGFINGLAPNSEVRELLKPFVSAISSASDELRQNRKSARAIAKERAELEEKLKDGSITQDDYNNETARLDAEEQKIRSERDASEQKYDDSMLDLDDAIKSALPRTVEEYDKMHQELEQKWLDEQNGVKDMTLHEKALYNALPFVRSMVEVTEHLHGIEVGKARVKALEDKLKADAPNSSDTQMEAAERKDRRLMTSLDLAQAKKDLSATRLDARNRLGDFVTELKSLLETGRLQYAEEQERRVERRKEVVRIGIGAVNDGKNRPEGVAGQQESVKGKDKADNFFRRLWNFLFLRPTESAESMLSRVDVNHFSTEGDLYNLFMNSERGFIQSQDRKFSSISALRETVKGKCKEIFGKSEPKGRTDKVTFTQTFTSEEVDSATGNTVTTTHTVDATMTKGEALSVYLWSLSEKGRAKLEQQGIDQYAIEQIKTGLGGEWLQFGDWIVGDFLPNLYDKYNEKYVEKYGTELTQNENYFPWRIYGGDIITIDDLKSFDNGGAIPQPSALKERKSHNYDLSMTSDALNILNDHIADMEDWYHFADMREDISSLLSSRAFREMLNMRNPNMYIRFRDAMHTMAGMRVDKETVTSQVINELQRNLATSAISFRFWTALKQLQSTIAGFNYSFDPRYQVRLFANTFLPVGTSLLSGKFKNTNNLTAGLLGSCYWAWQNSPQFRNRLIEGNMGNAMLEYESSIGNGAKRYKAVRDAVSKLGMAANKTFDAIAVSIYMKSIYDYKYSRLIKQGLSQEDAHKQALIEAENNYNKTQQSSLLAYMSPMQVSNNPIEKGVTTFQTASLGFARKTINHVDDIFRAYRFMRTGKEKPLHCVGKAGKATIDTLWDGFVMPFSWNMLNVVGAGGFYAGAKAVFAALFGDNEDDEALAKDANGKTALDRFIEDHSDDVAFAAITAPLQGTVLNIIVNTYWSGHGNWTPTMGEGALNEMLRTFIELTSAWKNSDKTLGEEYEDLDEDAVKYTAKVFLYSLFKGGTGLDFKTVERLYNAFVDRKVEGKLYPFDNFVGASNFLSTPMSNLKGQEAREYYLGGYGKNSETATSLEDYIGKRAYSDGKIFSKDAKGKGAVVGFMRDTARKKDLDKYVDEWVNYHVKDAIDANSFHDEWIGNSERKKIRQQNARLEISDEEAKAKEDSLKAVLGYDQKTGNSERALRHNIVKAIIGKIKGLLTGGDKDRKKAFDAMAEVERIDAKPNHTHGDYLKLARELGVKEWTMIPKEVTSSGKFANASDVESGKISRGEIQGAYNLWATRDDSKADAQFNKTKKSGEPYIAKTKSILTDYAKGRISRGVALNKILEMGDNVPMAFFTNEVADNITKLKGYLSKAVKAGNDTAAQQIMTEIRRQRNLILERKWKSKEEVAKALLAMAKQ